MTDLDDLLTGLAEDLREIRDDYGWRESIRQLKKAARASGPIRLPATVLLRDYEHLIDGGLSPYLAIDVVLA